MHQHDELVPMEHEVLEHEEVRLVEDIIKEKDKEILELKEAFSISQSRITFLERENIQLKMNELLQSKYKSNMEANRGKGKKIFVIDQVQEMEAKAHAKRPRTRGLKRALEQEKQKIHQSKELTFDELISMEINEDKELWISRVNEHLDKLLKKAKRDNKLQRHMANHYQTRDAISQIRLKQLKKRLKEA